MTESVQVVIGSGHRNLAIVDSVAAAFATVQRISDDDARRLRQCVGRLTRWSLDQAYAGDESGELEVLLEAVLGGVHCVVADHGQPLAAFGGGLGPVPAELADLAAITRDLRLVNLGGDGKRLHATIVIPGFVPAEPAADGEAAGGEAAARGGAPAGLRPDDVTIRDARPGDAEGIAKLLYGTYGLSYPHADFYRPRWLAEQISTGGIFSTVAVIGDQVIGHHAMLSEHPGGAVESGVAVVDPAFRGLGIVTRLAHHSVARVRAAGVPAVLSRAVTHHPYSQRAERSLGFHTTALTLASAPGQTGRIALLAAYLCLQTPARPVSMPGFYAEPLTAAYANVGLERSVPRPDTGRAELGDLPAVTTEREGLTDLPGAAVITIARWGGDTRATLINELRRMVRGDDEVAYADLDLHSLDTAELDEIVELLRNYDFFYSGLMLFGRCGHDHLRLQAMLTHQVQIDNLVLDSDYSRSLRDTVIDDCGLLPSTG
ncbi:MAG: GNAT family N-acetyltransferase [Actinomycetes bacterium]